MVKIDEYGIKYTIPNNPKKRYRPYMYTIPKSKAYGSKQKDLEINDDSVEKDKKYWEFVAVEINKMKLGGR